MDAEPLVESSPILFRQIDSPAPDNWVPNIHWYVEYHDPVHDMAYPLGIAFVSDFSVTTIGHVIDFIYVVENSRRKGIATVLVDACLARWSDVLMTDPISPEGRKFLNGYRRYCIQKGQEFPGL